MRRVLSPESMRALENTYRASAGVSGDALMERAASAVVDVLLKLNSCGLPVAFLCGPGNNGGDGLAAARLYARRGGRSIVALAYSAEKFTGDARLNYERAQSTRGVSFVPPEPLPEAAVYVDALFGIGLSRPLDETAARLASRMEWMRKYRSARVLAIDVPSGLCARTGRALGPCVQADVTVTFQTPKYGHLLMDGLTKTGVLLVRPIGIPSEMIAADAWQFGAGDIARRLRPRGRNTHKGDYGHLLLIAGSAGMAGAAILSARAALRSGAGLVTIACPESILPILQAAEPCAMAVPLPEKDGALSEAAGASLLPYLKGKTALAIGPGLSRRAHPAPLRAVLDSPLPAVFDADALNLLSENEALLGRLAPRHVITPHPGEAARLLKRPMGEPVSDAKALHALGAVAILKGAASVVASDRIYLRTMGNSGLAKGGSGDVLTGLIASLLAQGYESREAAWLGAGLHGLLGDVTARALGETAMTAADLIASLPALYKRLIPECRPGIRDERPTFPRHAPDAR